MTRREKRISKMRQSPKNVRYNDFIAALNDFGFAIRTSKGSHRVARIAVGDTVERIVYAEPHGKKKYVNAQAVERLLEIVDKLAEDEEANDESED